MLNETQELRALEQELIGITSGGVLANAKTIWGQQLDALRPSSDISTHEVAVKYRIIKTDGGGEVPYNHSLTPHLKEVHDACDDPTKRIVAIKGPARSGKTIAFENHLLKVGMFGPSRNMLWYMHSEPDVRRYVDERVDFFLRAHGELWEKRDRAKVPKWNLRRVDGGLWEWLAANPSTTRARSASLIVGDEIDAMRQAIRDAIITLMRNRQREYGSQAKILVASHPDAGPLFGIDAILVDSDMRVRMGICPNCAHLVGAAREVTPDRRMVWNMAELMKQGEDMPRDELLDFIAEAIRLICPHCKLPITNDERLEMRHTAKWMGLGQTIAPDETIIGDLTPKEIAGFVFHAIDAPFDSVAELARQWADAKLVKDETGSTAKLKEVTVKTIGETYIEDEAGSKVRQLLETKVRLIDTGYSMGTVPRGVDFLTGFIDVQGNRFEPVVIGWSGRTAESWLIDRYSAMQMEGFSDIRPGLRLADWDIIEQILNQTYPLNDGSGHVLGIATMGVDTGGVPGVTDNARRWAANLFSRAKDPIPAWRIRLLMGDAHTKGDFVGAPRTIKADKAGREYPVPVLERTTNVTELKKIIANRMDIAEPGPLRMHLPVDVTDAHVRELISATLINGKWYEKGRNELWDGWVGAEVCRQLMAPENRDIDWEKNKPIWAQPFLPSQDPAGSGMAAPPDDFYDRLRNFNKGRGRR